MKRLAVLLLVLLAVGCAHRQAPIYTPSSPIPVASQGLPLSRIEEAIRAAGMIRGWRMERQGPGHLMATQQQDKFSATVDITFDRRMFHIAYRDSTGLGYNGSQIHAHYNFWVRNLESDIRNRLAQGQ